MDAVIVQQEIPHHPRERGPVLEQNRLPSTAQGRKSKGDVLPPPPIARIPRCWVRSEWLEKYPSQVHRTADIPAELFAPYLDPPEVAEGGPTTIPREAVRANAEAGPSRRVHTPSVESDDGAEDAQDAEEVAEGVEDEEALEYE